MAKKRGRKPGKYGKYTGKTKEAYIQQALRAFRQQIHSIRGEGIGNLILAKTSISKLGKAKSSLISEIRERALKLELIYDDCTGPNQRDEFS